MINAYVHLKGLINTWYIGDNLKMNHCFTHFIQITDQIDF